MELETNAEMPTDRYMRRRAIVERAAIMLNATESDIPGLWNAPGYPELTTSQLVQIAAEKETP